VIRIAITAAAYDAIAATLPLGSEAYEQNTVTRGGDYDHRFYSPRYRDTCKHRNAYVVSVGDRDHRIVDVRDKGLSAV
jgi:hypothetical protein